MTHNKNNKNNKITEKQQKFVNSVASGDSATTAYIDVYDCKRESAASASSRLLKKRNIRYELSRLKTAAENDTLMLIDQKRAWLSEVIMTPALAVDPSSSLAQSATVKRKINADGSVEENVTIRMPNKLKAMELDSKLCSHFQKAKNVQDGDTHEIWQKRYNEFRERCPCEAAKQDLVNLVHTHEHWSEREVDPFDGRKKEFLKHLSKAIEIAENCRFAHEDTNERELNDELLGIEKQTGWINSN